MVASRHIELRTVRRRGGGGAQWRNGDHPSLETRPSDNLLAGARFTSRYIWAAAGCCTFCVTRRLRRRSAAAKWMERCSTAWPTVKVNIISQRQWCYVDDTTTADAGASGLQQRTGGTVVVLDCYWLHIGRREPITMKIIRKFSFSFADV